MAERRVRVPKDKSDLINRLTKTIEYPNGPFRSRADVLIFCAAYGDKHKERRSFKESADPIRYDVFENQDHDVVFDILALAETNEPSILANTDESWECRNTIFEEYASGGLEILKTELQGAADPLETLLLLMQQEIPSVGDSGLHINLATPAKGRKEEE